MKIILASRSPRRKKLLEQIGLPFTVEPSEVSEAYDPDDSPQKIVCELALQKARQVARGKTDALIIGADTLVVLDDTILEKPGTTQEAMKILSRLSGSTHQVLTGVALLKTEKKGNIDAVNTFFERTDVTFAKLTEDEIHKYVETGSPMDKAGAYGIQDDHGALFVKEIKGDYYNVVGFPLHSFYTILKQFAPELIAKRNLKL